MTHKELLRRVDAAELTEWYAYFANLDDPEGLEVFPDRRAAAIKRLLMGQGE